MALRAACRLGTPASVELRWVRLLPAVSSSGVAAGWQLAAAGSAGKLPRRSPDIQLISIAANADIPVMGAGAGPRLEPSCPKPAVPCPKPIVPWPKPLAETLDTDWVDSSPEVHTPKGTSMTCGGESGRRGRGAAAGAAGVAAGGTLRKRVALAARLV